LLKEHQEDICQLRGTTCALIFLPLTVSGMEHLNPGYKIRTRTDRITELAGFL